MIIVVQGFEQQLIWCIRCSTLVLHLAIIDDLVSIALYPPLHAWQIPYISFYDLPSFLVAECWSSWRFQGKYRHLFSAFPKCRRRKYDSCDPPFRLPCETMIWAVELRILVGADGWGATSSMAHWTWAVNTASSLLLSMCRTIGFKNCIMEGTLMNCCKMLALDICSLHLKCLFYGLR